MKRIQISFGSESSQRLDELLAQANDNFLDGNVTVSDIVEWAVMNTAYDMQKIRLKRINPKKVLRNAAIGENLDIDAVISKLSAIKRIQGKTPSNKGDV